MNPEIIELLQEINANLKELNQLFIDSHNDRKDDFDRIHDKLRDMHRTMSAGRGSYTSWL